MDGDSSGLHSMPMRQDLFLSPHSDDACFSLGRFAQQRGTGTLLTIFTTSRYRGDRIGTDIDGVRAITRTRFAEDARFADACGLRPQWLRFPDALMRGQRPFEIGPAQALSIEIADYVMRAVRANVLGLRLQPRPWLFCPMGIGGHVDHVALALLVLHELAALRMHFRVAFYEDLHYASDPVRRSEGLRRFRELCAGHKVERHALALGDTASQKAKMKLVQLYESQLTPGIQAIGAYTPADAERPQPHEAVWIVQDEAHQRAG